MVKSGDAACGDDGVLFVACARDIAGAVRPVFTPLA